MLNLNKECVGRMINPLTSMVSFLCIRLCAWDQLEYHWTGAQHGKKKKNKGMSMFYTLTCDVRSLPLTYSHVDMGVGGGIGGLMLVFICGPLVSISPRLPILHFNARVDKNLIKWNWS